MGSLVQCLLRNCFENDNDERGDEDDNEHDPHHRPDAFLVSPAPDQMTLNREGYIPPNAAPAAADTEQRQSLTAAQHNDDNDDSRRHFRLANFLCQLRQCIQHHTQHHQQQNQNQQMSNSPTTTTTQQQQNNHNITPGSPLRPAHEFTKPPKLNSRTCTNAPSSSSSSSNNHNNNRNNPSLDAIPAIALDEVVLPGSDLQKQMALYLQQQGYNSLKKKKSKKTTNNDSDEEEEEEDLEECVICMEGFDETNPRMPTICGCGENKTYFHLPCLYQWIGDGVNGGDDGRQNRDCPSCRQPLQWEEF